MSLTLFNFTFFSLDFQFHTWWGVLGFLQHRLFMWIKFIIFAFRVNFSLYLRDHFIYRIDYHRFSPFAKIFGDFHYCVIWVRLDANYLGCLPIFRHVSRLLAPATDVASPPPRTAAARLIVTLGLSDCIIIYQGSSGSGTFVYFSKADSWKPLTYLLLQIACVQIFLESLGLPLEGEFIQYIDDLLFLFEVSSADQ